MGELSQARMGAVRQLIELVPDTAIRTLETALAHGARGDQSLVQVQGLVGAEMLDRQARSLAFGPLLPLCEARRDQMQSQTFPRAALGRTWRALRTAAPEQMNEALRAFATLRNDEPLPGVFDALCRRAATGLRGEEAAFAPVAELLNGPNELKLFAYSLGLTPLARRALERLPTWLRTLSGEHAAAIRLAFRDAASVGDDAGPPFLEILFAHMEQPHEVLRLISLVMDRPSDRYLAASELASFGERLLGDLDRRIEGVRRFDTERGLEGGVALAGSVQTATAIIHEFEQWLALNKEGPWGSRIAAHKRTLAMTAEARLREAEPAVNMVLPFQPGRPSAKKVRGAPRLNADPDIAATTKAQALLAFLCETRSAANYGGFGSVRSKVIEALDSRIDQYAEDLLDLLHHGEGAPAERIRAFLEICAEFLGLVRDPKAAEIVRRRAAVA